jgi:hypothetical protein
VTRSVWPSPSRVLIVSQHHVPRGGPAGDWICLIFPQQAVDCHPRSGACPGEAAADVACSPGTRIVENSGRVGGFC